MSWVLLSWVLLNILHLLQCRISVDGYLGVQWIHSNSGFAVLERSYRTHARFNEANNSSSKTATKKLLANTRPQLTSITFMDNKPMFVMESATAFNIVRRSRAYVDKTLLLKEWITNWPSLLYVTAPAGFGKSSILDMIKNFCDTQYDIINGSLRIVDRNKTIQHASFAGTNFFLQEKVFFYEHFMQYNVIYINFEPLLTISDYDSFKKAFCGIVKSMIEPYRFLLNDTLFSNESKSWIKNCTQADSEFCSKLFDLIYINSGNVLLTLLSTTFNRPTILLVDGYDSVLYAQLSRKVLNVDWIMKALESFIEGLVKHPYYPIDKALFMGTLNMGISTSTLAYNIAHQDFFENEFIAKFFGFSEEEVKDLLNKFSLSKHYGSIRDYSGGYSVVKSQLRMVSNVPVLRFIQEKKMRPFLNESFPNKILMSQFTDLFSCYKIGSTVIGSIFQENTTFTVPSEFNYHELANLREITMCCGASEADDLSDIRNLFLNLILETGLLSVSEKSGHRVVSVANNEAKEVLLGYLERIEFSSKLFKVSENSKVEFQKSVISLQPDQISIDRFGEAVFKMFIETLSNPYAREKDYIFSIYTYSSVVARIDSASFKVEGGVKIEIKGGEKLGQEGRKYEIIDILLFFKQKGFGIIIEADFEHGARAALDRIVRNRFFDIFKTREEYSKCEFQHMILIGISVTREGYVSMDYLIDSADVKEVKEYRSDTRNIKGKKGKSGAG